MRHYKIIKDGELQLLGTGEGGEEISQEEYNKLLEDIQNTPIEIPIIEDGEKNEELSD